MTYVVHLMAVAPMLVLELPFGKWAHMAYRPLAVYLVKVQLHAKAAAASEAKQAEALS